MLHSIWSTLMLQVTPVVVAIVKAIVKEDVDRAFSTYTIEKWHQLRLYLSNSKHEVNDIKQLTMLSRQCTT